MINKELKEFKKYLEKSKVTIFIIILFLLLSFGQRLISNSFSMDTEFYISHYLKDFNWWIGLDRWGLVLINKILSIGPLIIFQSNILTVINMAIYSILYCYLFYLYIPKKWENNYIKYQFIFPIMFITNPIFAEQYNFINQNVAVSLGICLISISQILLLKSETLKKRYKIIVNCISIFLATLTFGIYQSMIPLYILVVACTYFLKCIDKNDNCWNFLLNRIVNFTIITTVYLVICKIIGGENTYLQSGWSKNGIECFRFIYYVVVDMLKCRTIFYNISYLVAITIIIAINIYLFFKKKNKLGIILSSIGLLLSPLYIMIITGVDQLKRTQFNYSFVIGFILLIGSLYIINNKKSKYLGYLIIILSVCFSYKQANITGKLFYSDSVRFENDTVLANKIQSKIENSSWYNKKKKYTLVILGKQECKSNNFYEKGEVIGNSFFEFDYQYYYGPSQRANAFMKTLGYTYKEPTVTQFNKAKQYVKENNTSEFPNEDSVVKMNNNTIVVRLSKEI